VLRHHTIQREHLITSKYVANGRLFVWLVDFLGRNGEDAVTWSFSQTMLL
jgi:hypothetical protein